MKRFLTMKEGPEWKSVSDSIKARKVDRVEGLARTENDPQLLATVVSFTQLKHLIAEPDVDITLFYPQP